MPRHTQAVLQGGFILAKATGDANLARESVDHLIRYVRLLFGLDVEPKPLQQGRLDQGNIQPDDPVTVELTLAGAPMMILTSGPHYNLTPAASINVLTEDQDETDRLWDSLAVNGGETGHCGWVVDRFGASWQIVPKRMLDLPANDDPAVVSRVSKAMMRMGKINIAALEAAAEKEEAHG